jgi:hypothetical protein
MISLTVVLADAAALRALFEEHLSKGRAFVAGAAGVAERESCELVLEHHGRAHRLVGEVVHVRTEEPGCGVGLALARLDTNATAALRRFVDEANDDAEEESPGSEGHAGAASLHERIRSLSAAEQLRLASAGTLGERTALERMYGPTVWEPLLRNARVTIPEVARIARKGSLPRPLVDLIASNAPWLASGEVQRALLSNPRSSPAVIAKVLGAMSRHDLMLVPQQTAYPEPVRAAAKKRLGR